MIDESLDQHAQTVLFEQCESIISQGFDELKKIERALALIDTQKLYKEHYNDFEDYCSKKWNLERELHYLCCFRHNEPKYILKEKK